MFPVCLLVLGVGTALAMGWTYWDPDNLSAANTIARRGSIVAEGLAGDESVRCVQLPAVRHAEIIHRITWEAHRLPALVRLLPLGGYPRRTSRPARCGDPAAFERMGGCGHAEPGA